MQIIKCDFNVEVVVEGKVEVNEIEAAEGNVETRAAKVAEKDTLVVIEAVE